MSSINTIQPIKTSRQIEGRRRAQSGAHMATSGNGSVNIWASALAIAAVIALFRFGTLQALFACCFAGVTLY